MLWNIRIVLIISPPLWPILDYMTGQIDCGCLILNYPRTHVDRVQVCSNWHYCRVREWFPTDVSAGWWMPRETQVWQTTLQHTSKMDYVVCCSACSIIRLLLLKHFASKTLLLCSAWHQSIWEVRKIKLLQMIYLNLWLHLLSLALLSHSYNCLRYVATNGNVISECRICKDTKESSSLSCVR